MNTVTVSSDGKFETAPDTAIVQFNITAQEKTSEAAYARVSKATETVREALKAKNVDTKAAELSRYSVQPIVDWRSNKRKVIAYRVTTFVSLKLKDFDKVGPLTEAMASIDEAENQSVSYSLENTDEAKSKAVEDAMRRARNMAEIVAKTSNRAVGDLSHATVDTSVRVVLATRSPQLNEPMMARLSTVEVLADGSGGNYTPPPTPTQDFTPKTISVMAHVNAVFGLK